MQAFNRPHGIVGHVFQGRYKAILVEKGSHLLELCRYVVLNPVRAGMVEKPEDWPWSSYKSKRYPGRPLLTRLFADMTEKDRQHRTDQIVQAHMTYGYTLKEIADSLNVHYRTVSKIVAGSREK